jgi:hypothetical protein
MFNRKKPYWDKFSREFTSSVSVGHPIDTVKEAREHRSRFSRLHAENLAIRGELASVYTYLLNLWARFWDWNWNVKLTIQEVSF